MFPQPRDDLSLLYRYQSNGDLTARDELVTRYLPLVKRLAKRYSYTSEPLDDLSQVGAIALLKAIDRFRPDRGSSFRAYAVPTIVGEMRRHFRDTGWSVHIPRALQERARDAGAAVNDLSAKHGRSPTIAEIAESMHVTREEVIEALEARLAYDAASLDGAVRTDEGGEALADRLGAEDASFEQVEARAMLESTLHGMPARERVMVHLRFAEDMSQSEIAKTIGVSQMHVSRLLRRALKRMEAATTAA
jgi:RNA polymerase sigma-B factor